MNQDPLPTSRPDYVVLSATPLVQKPVPSSNGLEPIANLAEWQRLARQRLERLEASARVMRQLLIAQIILLVIWIVLQGLALWLRFH